MSHRTIAGEERLKCYGVYVNTMKRGPGSYLVIELANRCSLACVHCAVADTEHPHFEQTGYLDARVADALFSDLAKHKIGFETLILFWLGEPLLHPEFPRIWASALRSAGVQKVFQKIEVHTNATHLSPRVTSALLNVAAVPSVIHFSLDAATRERYLAVLEGALGHLKKSCEGYGFDYQLITGPEKISEALAKLLAQRARRRKAASRKG
jgi:molybdenum cofactor biosynthesis enzyme MoaA